MVAIPHERRIALRLASVFALRMVGLFLVLPVLADYARHLPGGDSATRVGLALGVYGLTQALFLLPFGWASDRWGRKPVITFGLALFILGGLLAAWAPTVEWLIAARAVQGAGAISAAVTALVADLTSPTFRTRAMAMIGASIGLAFAGSLALAPWLYGLIGMRGIFLLTALLGGMAWVMVARGVPNPPRGGVVGHREQGEGARGGFAAVVGDHRLLRLDFGVFALHFVQMAMWVVVPALLVTQGGLPVAAHWQVYGAAVIIALALMVPLVVVAEKRGRLAQVYRGAVVLLTLVQLALALFSSGAVASGLWPLALSLTLFFVAFNVLEATQPSWISKIAPPHYKGAALGVYNTLQSLGLFAGGALGGWMVQGWGAQALFLACALLALLWYAFSLKLSAPAEGVEERNDGVGQ
ncbi:MFS transporter [Hydrogenophilus islandicus]